MSPILNKLVLLVEDNPTDEKLALRALRGCGVPHDVAVVRDGAEALDFLFATGTYADRGGAQQPDVILLDLKLPRVDGREVLRRLRADERTRRAPVVVLTSSREDEDVLDCYGLGANAYVRKPVDYGEFAEAAKTLGQFWLSINETPPPVT